MEIELAWLLLLPVVFGMGWLLAKYDRRQQHRESRHLPRDILDGASAILGDDYALATESLLKAARSAPDSPDLHRVVGNLYRKRGMTDRAIEVHETALRNPALSADERQSFLLDLGRDFLAAGIFDRAEGTLKQLLGSTHADSARQLLLTIAQRTRDWQTAIQVAQDIEQAASASASTPATASASASASTPTGALASSPQAASPQASAHALSAAAHFPLDHTYAQLMGHFYCELTQAALARHDWASAQQLLEQAAAFDAPGPKKRLEALRQQMDRALNKDDVVNAAAGINQQSESVVKHLQATATTATPASLPQVFICTACGFRTRQHYWQCPGCHRWDSVEVSR